MDKDQARIAFNMLDQAIENGEQTKLIEFKLKTKEGNSIYFKSSGIPLKENGKVYAVLCIAQDITEHKKVEERLQKLNEETQTILNSVPSIIFYKDRNERLIWANKAFADVLNMTVDKVIVLHNSF